ncbi:MAG TPA: MarR family transcriptional regulator [Pseudonocardiaceae bacterium]|jgi:DNA-binding MarR family transcriptional regulator|nr:MarR family transcriptional regulator [Pseudonocardiaceae bacterium]
MAANTALSADETHIWRSLLRLSDLLRFRVAADVRKVSDLSAADHSVLLHLAETDSGRILQQDLASSMFWSKSRISHQLARMEARGLLTRMPDPNSRQIVVSITKDGRAVINAVTPAHANAVRRHLLDHATAEELTVLVQLAERIRDDVDGGIPY